VSPCFEDSPDPKDHPRARWTAGWPGAILAAIAILVLYLFLASRTNIRDRDEGWYCRATAEMIASGNYLYPTFNDKPFLDDFPYLAEPWPETPQAPPMPSILPLAGGVLVVLLAIVFGLWYLKRWYRSRLTAG